MGLKTITKIFAMSLLLASCTEEVAEELKNNASSNPLGGGSTVLTSSSMRLEHKMDDSMSFQLHAAGTQANPCEISPPTNDGFDPADYYKDPSLSPDGPQVIDCILEAQENDLFQQGAKFELQVDEQLCEYIAYTPFKYIERQFGNTQKTVYQVECTGDASVCSGGGVCDTTWDTYSYSGTVAGLSNPVDPDNLTCAFDYSNDSDYAKNCDEGSITTVTLEIDNTAYDHDGDADTPEICPTVALVPTGTSEYECGGEHYECVGGPAVDYFGEAVTTREIFSNTDLGEFVQEFEVEAPILRQGTNSLSAFSNMYLTNYSRICSDTSATKDYADNYVSMPFNGYDWESIRSDNRTMYVDENGTKLFLYYDSVNLRYYYDNAAQDGADACDYDTADLTYPDCAQRDYIAYAENPWRAAIYTSPYYSFKCLDQAKDVKAQIRLFIRDWDRNFTGNPASFALVSDAGTATPLMDDPTGDQDGDLWNDVWDWDDWFGDETTWESNQCSATNTTNTHESYLFPGKL